jgi:uncharacterized membrane protein YphA (DoxX/SURF4 family)
VLGLVLVAGRRTGPLAIPASVVTMVGVILGAVFFELVINVRRPGNPDLLRVVGLLALMAPGVFVLLRQFSRRA